MKTTTWLAGGIVALGLLAGAPGASAAPLGGAPSTLAGPLNAVAAPQDVRWVRRCWRQRTWWGGRPHWVTRCRNVWVGPRYYRW